MRLRTTVPMCWVKATSVAGPTSSGTPFHDDPLVAVGVEFDGLNGESPCVGLGFVERTHKRERALQDCSLAATSIRPIGKDRIGAACMATT